MIDCSAEGIHSKRILVVERDLALRELLTISLLRQGFDVQSASDPTAARACFTRHRPDLAIIGVISQGRSSLEFLQAMKQDPRTRHIPMVALTLGPGDQETLRAFEAGADDCVLTPHSLPELLARVRALLRRAYRNDVNGRMDARGLVLDMISQRVSVKHHSITLAPLEFRLLAVLMANAERVLGRAFILRRVWETPVPTEIRSVDVQVAQLRQVLKPHRCDRYIQTVRGFGYRFSTYLD